MCAILVFFLRNIDSAHKLFDRMSLRKFLFFDFDHCVCLLSLPSCLNVLFTIIFISIHSMYIPFTNSWTFWIFVAKTKSLITAFERMSFCYPSSPRKLAITVAFFASGAALFAVGIHLSYLNVAPQQARTKARNDFVKERIRQKQGKWLLKIQIMSA